MSSADIAIVGMACRFAGDAKSPEAFHEMLQKGKDAWSKIPKSRFNIDAYQHPSRDRRGTMVCEGGYFLDQDVTKWDAPFFSCSASEARAYDPQQRLLLEVAYESLENAGIPVANIANTDAACFVGGFSEDYKAILMRDLHAAPQYAKTGTALSMLSNRVSWFFNLRGPSVTCDTACSSSMTALHLACESIRSESSPTRCALVGGANLILEPDDQCGLNALGFFSPEGRSFSFDSRANGYARGEGISMIVIKHLDDALRDGDPIRAVIRGTGLNSDGRTAGITLPSAEAQEMLITNTYRTAGLDPSDTQYVELHGTGTKAGDAAEVRAIANTFTAGRSGPLYCGSVKSRVGHTEASAGVASIIKSVLCLEKGVITPNLNFVKANPRLRLESSGIVVPTSTIAWPHCEVRRCSINNFGFGGTNAHIIIDDAYNYLRLRGKLPVRDTRDSIEEDTARPRVFVLSAPEQAAVSRQRQAHARHLQSRDGVGTLPSRLGKTLNERRSIFQWRHAAVASSLDELRALWQDEQSPSVKTTACPNVAFVFTGQGAQWYGMGRELASFDEFSASVRRSASYLSGMGCSWNAWTELMTPKSASESKLSLPEYSQPLCLVLQIALVDLAEQWGIKPCAVIGHSSGEIAAAYAAGALNQEDCLKIAYYRGLASKMAQARQPNGSMMAVGLSPRAVVPYLGRTRGAVVLACINGPESVTLAGDKAALQGLEAVFKKEQKFCRLLQVENAYHSPQMLSVRSEYEENIKNISSPRADSSIMFYSTLHGRHIPTSQLTAEYWVENLCSPVQFVAGLDDMMYANVASRQLKTKSKLPSILLELGPHSALAGPVRQYKAARDGLEKLSYFSFLARAQDAAVTALRAAGSLWTMGVPVKLNKVNNDAGSTTVMVNLPAYQWNHSTSYWLESRQSRNHRLPRFARHDLIGSRLDSYNPLEPVWKNHLRIAELPWLRDHQIQGDVVFPAAGMICSAIEAAKQISEADGSSRDIRGFEIREFSVSEALVIPTDDVGVEISVSMKRRKVGMGSGAGHWYEFSYYSCQGDVFVEHASGLLQIQHSAQANEVDAGKECKEEVLAHHMNWGHKRAACLERVTRSGHYEFCEEQGLCFGKTFQGLRSARKNGLTVAFETKIADTRACMPEFQESDYVVHPATLDSVFQAMMITVPRMEGVEKQVWVPTGAANISISSGISRGYSTVLHGLAESELTGVREMTASVVIKDEQGESDSNSPPAIVIDDFKFTGLGSTHSPKQSSDLAVSKYYSSTTWKPDLSLVDGQALRNMIQIEDEAPSHMRQFFSMANRLVNKMCRLALSKLDLTSGTSTPPHLLKYAQWMRKRCENEDAGIVTPPRSPDNPSPPPELPDLMEMHDDFTREYPIDGQLAFHVFQSLGAIFAQETTPIAALRQGDMLPKAYRDVYGLHITKQLLQSWFDLKAHKQPSLRVIEIGAGTASTTLPLLQRLGADGSETPRFHQWTFTDISAGWFDSAATALQDWKSHVEYKVLDIDQDPTEQGFEAESYDVVLAVNVLHATKKIHTTLQNCKKLLKPGGNLVLGEYTNPNELGNFVFGIMPGWWASEDGRDNGPLLRQSQWDEALLEAGFSGADISLAENDDPIAHRMSMIVSTKPRRETPSSETVTVVIGPGCSDATKVIASNICRSFRQLGHSAVVQDLGSAVADPSGKTIISLLEYEDAFLENVQETGFEQIKRILLHSQEVLWVTRSDPVDAPGSPAKRMISGLLRCLKTEDSSRRLYEMHFSHALGTESDSTTASVCQRLCTTWDGVEDDALAEMETEEREGQMCIPRYMPHKTMNDSLSRATQTSVTKAEMGPLFQTNRPLKMTIGQPGMLDTLHFVDDDGCAGQLLGEEVEIEVKTCALNFLDIMIAMGQIQRPVLGHEAAGIVRRVGGRTTRLSPGDRVLYIGPGAMRTHIRSHESAVYKLPDSMSLEDGVSIPIAYATAYQSLVEVARVQKGESVLIHAAAGGLGQALIQIAKMLEAEIFCTVGSIAKKKTIVALGVQPDRVFSSRDTSFAKGIKRVTGGRGVDVVVNSLAGEALRQSWRCLAPHGRFIEVGKKDILGNSGLDMQPFVNNTLFAGVNLEDMMVKEPLRCGKLLSKVLRLFERGAIDFIRPIVVHDFSKVESVFREMQRGSHIGKLVLRATPESRVPILPRAAVPLCLKEDVTYLLVGGLGGLGRAQALFMAENGARHIAFLSRSGSARPEAKALIATLEERGVEAKAFAADVADKAQLQSVLDQISKTMPPIRGVIQGAMVLADSLFHRMSYDQWVSATRPKVQGTWNLHELLPQDLEFFVVLSSLAGIIGSVSQSNYAAGNTFLDALVHYRRQKGMPAHSLDIGVMTGIGYVEEHDDARARTSHLRVTRLGEQQFMHALRCSLAGTVDGNEALPPQLLVGAGSGGIQQAVQSTDADADADFYWLRSLAPFAYLRQMDTKSKDGTSAAGPGEESEMLHQLTLCKSMDGAVEAAQNLLMSRIAKHISIAAEDISADKPIHTYGVDSLVAVELRNWLSMSLKCELSIFDLTSSAPISDVSKKIASKSQLVPAAVMAQTRGGA